MEQIYYTQCPIGYGLGASNGFQIKRLGPGYPPSGDVRHLALRAFLPGSNGKQLAPGTLRYRRVGPIAEVAWLEPRGREYETERGQWGRPGGHFAHGIRLDPEEFEAIARWPAGLYDRPFWRRSDPEPSRGRRPDDLTVGPDDLIAPPDFAHVAPLIDLDAESLATLLAKVAEAARSGRTLFLLDEPRRLGPTIAALTFAFPAALRADLTFSTYHDRPEELSGFRIHGTTPSPLINRALLAGLGPIADLTAGRPDPGEAPPGWARTLATWLTRREPADAASWTRTDLRARRARRPDDPAELWSDAWLDGLIGLDDVTRSPLAPPSTADQWRGFAGSVAWASRAGLLGELADPRTTRWWQPIAREASRDPSAHDAFWCLLRSAELWSEIPDADAARWGAIAAPFWTRSPELHREQRLRTLVRTIPTGTPLARFLDGLIRTVPPEVGRAALASIDRLASLDERVLLPLRARNAVALALERPRADAIDRVLLRAIPLGATLETVLDVIADEAARLGQVGPIAALVADRLVAAGPDGRDRFESWALRRRDSGGDDWIAPALRRVFATDLDRADWDALRDRTEPPLRPALAESCLEVASGPDAHPSAFSWAVERLLLEIPEADRDASSTRWAAPYLTRSGSPVALASTIHRVGPPLADWLDTCRAEARLGPEAITLLDDALAIVRLIQGRGAMPSDERLARLPATDRGPVLGLLIDRVARGDFEASLPLLERCARRWPDAFEPQAAGIDAIARPIAELLLQFLPDRGLWIGTFSDALDRLGVDRTRLEPMRLGGIAARIVAETVRMTADPIAAWELRAALIRDDRLYPTLAEDLARDLRAERPTRAVDVSRRWVLALDKGEHTGRFFEVLLNACDGPRLAMLVPEYANELWTLGPLPWWSAPAVAGEAPDLREAFAALIPMAPLAGLRSQAAIEAWLHRRRPSPTFRSIRDDPDLPLLVAPEPDPPPHPPDAERPAAPLSDHALARWRCVVALTALHWDGKTDEARWAELKRWRKPDDPATAPPVARLDLDDRYAMLSWILVALEHPGADSFELESLARWAAKELGLRSRQRIAGCLDPIAAGGRVVPAERARLARDLAHLVGLQRDD